MARYETWINCQEYTSPGIVNEILALLDNTVLRSFVIANEATNF